MNYYYKGMLRLKIKSLGLKISLIVSLLILVIVALIILVVTDRTEYMLTRVTAEQARTANQALAKTLEGYQRDAIARAEMMAYSPDVFNAIIGHNDAGLKVALQFLGNDMDGVVLCDEYGTVKVRTHNNEKGDQIVEGTPAAITLATGQPISSIERGPDGGIYIYGSAAIRNRMGQLIGVISCHYDLSLSKYVDEIKEVNSSEVTIYDGDSRLSTTLMDENGDRLVETRAPDAIIDAVINQRQPYDTRTVLFGRNYEVYYTPLIVDDEVLGMLFAGVNVDYTLQNQQAMMTRVIAVAAIAGVIGVLVIMLFGIFAVSRPLKKIGAFANKIKAGDLGISTASEETTGVRSSDEIGALARILEQAYSQLKGYVGEIKVRMHGLAEGDLVTESAYDFSGDFILIKDSINEIIHKLNAIMAQINDASTQVATGSKQIADSAQLLAQGATEQSATVEQLSASIVEISEQTKHNAGVANEAKELGEDIKQSAEQGNRQMEQMMAAVQEINESSKSIGKVIKIIDDIAFQTNILALNAAVEAARAGQHGKGFAVVADEVRSLAAKSAEAAKNTNELIESSVKKAEQGAAISSETAASLEQIVQGIIKTSALVADISKSSDEQSASIHQISDAIGQVSQVVQQNSATAEESSAAAEEMSGQSSMLEELIAQFKLKDAGVPVRDFNQYTASDTTAFTIDNHGDKY